MALRLRTLDGYVLKEILPPFLVGLGLFFVLIVVGQILKLSDAVTGFDIGLADMVHALGYALPPLLGLLLPMSWLFACLFGIGRLAQDREILAMAQAGCSPLALLRMPLLGGLLLAVLSAVSLGIGEPWGIRGLRQWLGQSAQRALTQNLRPQTFHAWVPGMTLMVEGNDHGKLRGVLLADHRMPQRPVVISAQRGTIEHGSPVGDIVFALEDGSVLLPGGDDTSRALTFVSGRYRLDISAMLRGKNRSFTEVQEKSLQSLWQDSRAGSSSPGFEALCRVTLHRKFALPLSAVVFGGLAVALAAGTRGGARAKSLVVSAALVGGYYYLGRSLELAARAGKVSAVLAAWGPNLVGLLLLLVLLRSQLWRRA